MTPSLESLGIDKLSDDEKYELIDAILASIPQDRSASGLSAAQIKELERRVAEDDAHPDDAIPWEEVEAKILARRK